MCSYMSIYIHVNMYIYIYTYVCMYVCIWIFQFFSQRKRALTRRVGGGSRPGLKASMKPERRRRSELAPCSVTPMTHQGGLADLEATATAADPFSTSAEPLAEGSDLYTPPASPPGYQAGAWFSKPQACRERVGGGSELIPRRDSHTPVTPEGSADLKI